VLRDLVRNQVFERFHLALGAAIGVSLAVLVAWGLALFRGPGALAARPFLALAAGLAIAGGIALPAAVERARRGGGSRAGLRAGFALGFALLVLAAGVAAFTAAFGALVVLLASAGLSQEAGLAIFRAGSAAGVVALAGALAWGFAVEPSRLEVTRTRVTLPGAQAGLRIAHLSDLHIGNGLEGRHLESLIERVNALAPDLVALTGDLFDADPAAVEPGARALGALRARLGVFAVLGNHDVKLGAEQVAAALRAGAPEMTLLRDAWSALPDGEPLLVAGVDDPGRDWTGLRGRPLPAIDRLAAALPAGATALLLVHRPDAFPQAARLGFRLVLAGHFHGGQVAVPAAGGRWNAARLFSPYHRGLYRAGEAQLYVSRGLGFAGPRVRIGARREIALLELAG